MTTPRHIRSYQDAFGNIIHYSEENGYEGISTPGLFEGSYNHYTPDGGYVGSSDHGITSDMNHFTPDNGLVGFSAPGLVSEKHYSYSDGLVGETYNSGFSSDTFFDADF